MFLEILQKLQSDPFYQESLHWGRPRRGHPEGALKHHIQDLEANLERIRAHLRQGEYERLRLLVHVHDICKPVAITGVDSHDSLNHAYLARQYLARFCQDPALLAITQHHDDGYYLHTYHRWSDNLGDRIRRILSEVRDVELFLLFNLVDNCLPGKTVEPLNWLLDQVARVHPVSDRIALCLSILRN